MAGALVAFEGIDQAGKLTQVRAVQARLDAIGLACELRHYPDYDTPIGGVIQSSLCGRVRLDARARAMLFAANRWEKDAELRALVERNALVLVDRYTGSNVVYGVAQGFDEEWLRGLETGLLEADVTLFVDISPQESRRRKASGRDDFERDVALLEQARAHYLRLAREHDWVVLDGEQPSEEVTKQVLRALRSSLATRFPELARDGSST
ncbi:MAG: dTMP kinase [Candidatus Krumholzibacteriia bacterium]